MNCVFSDKAYVQRMKLITYQVDRFLFCFLNKTINYENAHSVLARSVRTKKENKKKSIHQMNFTRKKSLDGACKKRL